MRGLTPYRRNGMRGITNYFDDFERAFFGGLPSFGLGSFRTDIVDKGDKFLLKADLPGVAKEDIHLDLDGNELVVSVKHEEDKEEKNENFVRRERVYGSYCRSFDVTGVDTDKITASYKDGVLELSLPKLAEKTAAGRKIDIN